MYSGHRRTFSMMSNDILIGLTEQEKTWVTENNKLIVLLKKIVCENRF